MIAAGKLLYLTGRVRELESATAKLDRTKNDVERVRGRLLAFASGSRSNVTRREARELAESLRLANVAMTTAQCRDAKP